MNPTKVHHADKPLIDENWSEVILTPGKIYIAGKLWVKEGRKERFPKVMNNLIR